MSITHPQITMKTIFTTRLLALLFLLLCCGTARCDYANFSEAIGAAIDELQAKNYQEAQGILDEALKFASNNEEKAMTYSVSGLVASTQGRFEQARLQLGKISKLDDIDASTRALALSQTGDTFMIESNPVKARAAYKDALKVDGIPKDFVFIAQGGVAETYLLEKSFDMARAEYEKMLSLKDSTPYVEAFVGRRIGESYIAESKFEKAREVLTAVLNFKSSDPSPNVQGVVKATQQSAQMDIAETYLLQKDYARAKQEYEKALAMEKLDPIRKAEIDKQLAVIKTALAQTNGK